jgi:hypothetical protein
MEVAVKAKRSGRLNFKRANTETLQKLFDERTAQGGWNPATMAEIQAELDYRQRQKLIASNHNTL